MATAQQTSDDQTSDKLIAEFTRRVIDGQPTADLFGVDDAFIDDVVTRAYQLYSSKKYDQAQVLLRGANALDETRAYTHLLLGDILLQQEQFTDAVGELDCAHQLAPDNAETLAKLGEAQARAKLYDTAVGNLERAVDQLDEDSPHQKRTQGLLEIARRGDQSEGSPIERPT